MAKSSDASTATKPRRRTLCGGSGRSPTATTRTARRRTGARRRAKTRWRRSRSHGGGCERARTTRRRSAEGAVMTDLEQFGAIVLIAFGVAIAVFVVLGVAQWLLS